MFTLSLAFIIFSGTMFSLQAASLTDNLRLFIGADLVVQVQQRFPENALDQRSMTEALELLRTRPDPLVVSYSFVSFPLGELPWLGQSRISNLPNNPTTRNAIVGVDENYMDSCYSQFYVVTELAEASPTAGIARHNSYTDVIKLMFRTAGQATLPLERDGIRVPNSIASAPLGQEFGRPYDDSGDSLQHSRAYTEYIDVMVSEALREFAAVSTKTPLSLSVSTVRPTDDATSPNSETNDVPLGIRFLAKARALVRQFPGFFFSRYSLTAATATVVVPMPQFERLMNQTFVRVGAPESLSLKDNEGRPITSAPKQKLMIRLIPDASTAQRQDVKNALAPFITSNRVQIIDTPALVDTATTSVGLLQTLFTVIAVIAMVLCFFILWLSFTSNVTENAWEFAVLRSLGLSGYQVTMLYVYEALALVLTCMFFGTSIGILIAVTLTLQFNLFVELPFRMSFPGDLFAIVICLSLFVAVLGSALPAIYFRKKSIANVLRRN